MVTSAALRKTAICRIFFDCIKFACIFAADGLTGPKGTPHLMNDSSRMETKDVLRVQLEVLKREHRDLDDAIHALQDSQRADQLRLRRLKKQKLYLKDKIAQIEDKLTPDIIA